jgi:hypothetical protein
MRVTSKKMKLPYLRFNSHYINANWRIFLSLKVVYFVKLSSNLM